MPRPNRIQFPGAIYHVFNRGAVLFRDDADRMAWITLLREVKEQFALEIYAYRLLADRFHLALKTPNGNLSAAMEKLNRDYARYAARKHATTGPLYQGRYRAKLVQKEDYLLPLIKHVHGPEGVAQWSSHPYYMGQKADTLVDTAPALAMFHTELDQARSRYSAWTLTPLEPKERKRLDAFRNGRLGKPEVHLHTIEVERLAIPGAEASAYN